jgi:protein-S-isoprenylcysteine O-methyltransferase Ste14
MNTLRAVAFTILMPGTVVGLVPYLLTRAWNMEFNVGYARYIGLIFLLAGMALYCLSVLAFLVRGGGTPSIWFTRKLRFLLGEEPTKLVSEGLYKLSRNPMYLGVVSIVLGESLLFQLPVLLAYFAFLVPVFHLVVVYLEEPHLRKKYGADYEKYLRSVPRWIGSGKGKAGGNGQPAN